MSNAASSTRDLKAFGYLDISTASVAECIISGRCDLKAWRGDDGAGSVIPRYDHERPRGYEGLYCKGRKTCSTKSSKCMPAKICGADAAEIQHFFESKGKRQSANKGDLAAPPRSEKSVTFRGDQLTPEQLESIARRRERRRQIDVERFDANWND